MEKKITFSVKIGKSLYILLIGAALLISGLCAMIYSGGEPAWFLDIPSLAFVILIGAALSLMQTAKCFTPVKFFGRMKTNVLLAGGTGALIGFMIMLHNMAAEPDSIGISVSVSLITMLYGIILSGIFSAVENWIKSSDDK